MSVSLINVSELASQSVPVSSDLQGLNEAQKQKLEFKIQMLSQKSLLRVYLPSDDEVEDLNNEHYNEEVSFEIWKLNQQKGYVFDQKQDNKTLPTGGVSFSAIWDSMFTPKNGN